MTVKVKDLIAKLQQCDPEDEVSILVNHYAGGVDPLYESDPELKTNADGKIFIIEGNGWEIERDTSVDYYTYGLLEI